MRDYIAIGPSPADEPCAQVGAEDCDRLAKLECQRFIDLIRKGLGEEPSGAHLAVKGFEHDFGRYYEVVCFFDDNVPEAVEYAYRCESDSPTRWEDVQSSSPSYPSTDRKEAP